MLKVIVIFLLSALAAVPSYLTALAISYLLVRLFPSDAPIEYFGVGFTPRLLPGTIVGLFIWLWIVRYINKRVA